MQSSRKSLTQNWSGVVLALVLCLGPPAVFHYGQYERQIGVKSGQRQAVRAEPRAEADAFLNLPFDGWVAAFTGLLFASTVGLWLATHALSRQAKIDAERQRRPWVALDLKGTFDIAQDEMTVSYQLKNVGLTPAVNVSVQATEAVPEFKKEWIANWNRIAEAARQRPRDFGLTLFPGGKYSDSTTIRVSVPAGETGGWLYFLTWAEYQFADFVRAHYTPITWAVQWSRDDIGIVKIVRWRQHSLNPLPD